MDKEEIVPKGIFATIVLPHLLHKELEVLIVQLLLRKLLIYIVINIKNPKKFSNNSAFLLGL
jgi:hypothetical protein